jgi:hypothetical protein
MKTNLKHCVWFLAMAGSISTVAFAADRAIKVDDRLDASADALTDAMRASDHGIPQGLIDKAHCVVVIPGMKKPDSFSAPRRAAGSRYAAGTMAWAGAPRLRCGPKVEVLDSRLAFPTPMLCCS